MRKEKKPFFKVLFYSYFFSLILILILILFLFGLLKNFFQKRQPLIREISILEEEIRKLEGEKLNLLETLEYLKSDFYKEKEAREKFGLQKPGEKAVVILPPEKKEEVKETTQKEISNFKKWWYYILNKTYERKK